LSFVVVMAFVAIIVVAVILVAVVVIAAASTPRAFLHEALRADGALPFPWLLRRVVRL